MRDVSGDVLESLQDGRMALIAGPRQVGKTTLAKALLSQPDNYFNWDVELHRQALLRSPDAFWTTQHGKTRVVLDEIHKYPRFKRFLKGLYDGADESLELIVTGSGRLDVYQKGGDSLFGRYWLHHLHPFTVGEYLTSGHQKLPTPDEFLDAVKGLPSMTGAAEALELIEMYSGFPEPLYAAKMDKLRRWRRSRRDLVLREDLRDLSRIRDLGLVDHLVELLPVRIGSPVSINALREELGVAFDTVKTWIAVLCRLYFLFELKPWSGKLARTLRKEAKLYFFEPTAIEDAGARFENVVALHLLKLVDTWNDRGYGDFSLGYMRDKERREVDFVIAEGIKPFALIEAKLSEDQPTPSLRYFHERIKPKVSLQVFRNGKPRKSGDIFSVPAERLLGLM